MSARRRLARGAALGALALAACGRERGVPDNPESAAAAEAADSAAADSAAAGPTLTAVPCGGAAPTGEVRAHPVSDGRRGMITVVRWTSSPDGCALLVVEDPVSVEAEPAMDRAVYVHERGVVARVDSAWDVQPDRAWQRLAVGRAYVAQGRDAGDTLPTSAWASLARATGRPVADVRAAAFPASGMSVAYAVAQPALLRLDSLASSGGDAIVPRARRLPLLGGWRVRWSEDGASLAVGAGPQRAGDDEPPLTWMVLDAATGRPLHGAEYGALPAPGWSDDLLLDASSGLDPAAARTIAVRGARVEGAGGRILLTRPGGAPRIDVGPGTPLAATANGRAILALVPRRTQEESQLPYEVVLYVIR